MTYTIDEIRAKARGARIAVAVTGLGWESLGLLSLSNEVWGDGNRFAEAFGWYWLVAAAFAWCFFVAVVMWLHWFEAVHRSTEPFGTVRDRGRWRLWGWLVPVASLAMPKRMVNDVWWTRHRRARLPWPAQVWWVLWLLVTLTTGPGLLVNGTAEVVLDVVRALLLGLAAPFAVWTIGLLTDRVTQPRTVAREAEVFAG